jgi:hypothetical protein
MTDRDMLVQVYMLVCDKEQGLVHEIMEIKIALLGDLRNSSKVGLIPQFRAHMAGHRKLERCIYGAIGGGGGLTALVELLRYFHFL